MTAKNHKTVVGVFHDPSHAQAAVRELLQAGFTDQQVGVVSHDNSVTTAEKGTKKKRTAKTGTHVAEGAAIGVGAGASVGALWALGIAAGVMPVIGPVVAGGILASVAASAAGGAAIAGIVGALVGLGLSEEEAQYYEGEFKAGRTIVTVKANGRADEAWAILQKHGAYNMNTAATAVAATGTASAESGPTVEVHEERLNARKKPVKKGEVRVRKEIVTEQQTLDVPVTREEVVIERRPATGRGKADDIRPGEEIRIPVTEERVQAEKENVVKEEVAVRKRKVKGTQKVSSPVRKEKVKVETEGEGVVRSDTATTK